MAPVVRLLITAMFWLSRIRSRCGYASIVGSKSLKTCLKAIEACPKLDTTNRLSALGSFSGPSWSTVAARIPASRVVLPLPRPRDRAASRTRAGMLPRQTETPRATPETVRLGSGLEAQSARPGSFQRRLLVQWIAFRFPLRPQRGQILNSIQGSPRVSTTVALGGRKGRLVPRLANARYGLMVLYRRRWS